MKNIFNFILFYSISLIICSCTSNDHKIHTNNLTRTHSEGDSISVICSQDSIEFSPGNYAPAFRITSSSEDTTNLKINNSTYINFSDSSSIRRVIPGNYVISRNDYTAFIGLDHNNKFTFLEDSVPPYAPQPPYNGYSGVFVIRSDTLIFNYTGLIANASVDPSTVSRSLIQQERIRANNRMELLNRSNREFLFRSVDDLVFLVPPREEHAFDREVIRNGGHPIVRQWPSSTKSLRNHLYVSSFFLRIDGINICM